MSQVVEGHLSFCLLESSEVTSWSLAHMFVADVEVGVGRPLSSTEFLPSRRPFQADEGTGQPLG